jgi:hypothetical protein
MARQANVSNQSVGGGSRGWAVIAPYIGSPNLFEGGVSGRRSSSSTSSGKNPFEDYSFSNENAEGLYAQSGFEYMTGSSIIEAELTRLQNGAFNKFLAVPEDQKPSVIVDFLQGFTGLVQQRAELNKKRQQDKDIYTHNNKLVEENQSKVYRDGNGLTIKTEDGHALTYADLHNLNSQVGLGNVVRMENPVNISSLYSFIDEEAAKISGTMTENETITYALGDIFGVKTSIKAMEFTPETQMQYSRSLSRIESEILNNHELNRAINAMAELKLDSEKTKGLTDEEYSALLNSKQNEVLTEAIDNNLKSSARGFVKSRVEEQRSRGQTLEDIFNTNPDKFTDLQKVILDYETGTYSFDQLKSAIIGKIDIGMVQGIPFGDTKTYYESGKNGMERVSVPSTKLNQKDYSHLNESLKQSGAFNRNITDAYFPPKSTGFGVLLKQGGTSYITDGKFIHDNTIGIYNIGGAEIRWAMEPTSIGVDEDNDDFNIYTTNKDAVKFNLSKRMFDNLSEEERLKIYNEYERGDQEVAYDYDNLLNDIPVIGPVGTVADTFTTDGDQYTYYALRWAKENMNSPEIENIMKEKKTGGFVPVTVIVRKDDDLTFGFDDEGKYGIKTVDGDDTLYSDQRGEREEVMRRVEIDGREYNLVDIEVWYTMDEITNLFMNDNMRIYEESLRGINQKKATKREASEAFEKAKIP